MKGNRIAFVLLILSAALLVAVAWQGNTISHLRTDLADSRQQTEELSEQLSDLQDQGVPRGWFEDVTIEANYHHVTATFLAELPGWDNTTAKVDIQVWNDYVRFSSVVLELSRGEDGLFRGELDGYMDPYTPLKLVLSDGTVLYESDSMASILPVQLGVFSGDTVYNDYSGQYLLYQAEWEVELTDLQGESAQVTDTAFREYLNGELVFEGPCYDHSGTQMEGFGLACEDGDYVELRYTCKDADGLTYEFPLEGWVIQGDKAISRAPAPAWPAIVWPT